MSLETEQDISLAFDTLKLRQCGNKYEMVAKDLCKMAQRLDGLLGELESCGWTTEAGSAFHKMTKTNWEDNIKKYADLLETLKGILHDAAEQYERLTIEHVEKTRL